MLREDPATKHLPVMMLTAKGTEFDTVSGLDAGADDYLAKPFGMMELVSRVNALMRRAAAPAVAADDEFSCGPIALTVSSHDVSVDGENVALTLKEFDLLRTLMQNEGHVLSRRQLLEDVWGMTYVGETRTVDCTPRRFGRSSPRPSRARTPTSRRCAAWATGQAAMRFRMRPLPERDGAGRSTR